LLFIQTGILFDACDFCPQNILYNIKYNENLENLSQDSFNHSKPRKEQPIGGGVV
jgi:biotin synthase-like enzyme